MNTLVRTYENLLVDNVGTVRSVESGLRNLTWLLPGRFEDADVASEGCMSPFPKFS
jgi:peroxin-16